MWKLVCLFSSLANVEVKRLTGIHGRKCSFTASALLASVTAGSSRRRIDRDRSRRQNKRSHRGPVLRRGSRAEVTVKMTKDTETPTPLAPERDTTACGFSRPRRHDSSGGRSLRKEK
jgi:hypothetical protein